MSFNLLARPDIYTDTYANQISGWGIYTFNLLKHATLRGHSAYALDGVYDLADKACFFLDKLRLFSTFQNSKAMAEYIKNGKEVHDSEAIYFSHYQWGEPSLNHRVNPIHTPKKFLIGFFEDKTQVFRYIDDLNANVGSVICASNWNLQAFKEAGYKGKAVYIPQGVDTDYFFPRSTPLLEDGNFYIFSGGKLELRKSQDIVLEAFAKLQQIIPNAKLVALWDWFGIVDAAKQMNQIGFTKYPFIIEQDSKGEEKVNIRKTASQYGIKDENIIILGPRTNYTIATILNQMHCAVFPNRCEAGTNLMAMEAIACGVPSIIANGTGQKDLLHICPDLRPIGLYDSYEIVLHSGAKADFLQDWMGPRADEVVERVIEVYKNRDHYRHIGLKSASYMANLSWKNQINMLLDYAEFGKDPIIGRWVD